MPAHAPCPPPLLPHGFHLACRTHGIRPGRYLLVVRVQSQTMDWFELVPPPDRRRRGSFSDPAPARFPATTPRFTPRLRRHYLISTSRFGIGQIEGSNQTPLGLHRLAQKAGGGWPIGVVLVNRQPVGFTWQGRPDAAIAHRVLWLEGLEPGRNRGANVDTFSRYIYIHGVGDETTLGRPASRGCVHLAAHDLMLLYDLLPVGTLVWISAR